MKDEKQMKSNPQRREGGAGFQPSTLRLPPSYVTTALALVTAFVLGGIIIWITSGKFETVLRAYDGLVRGAFFKQRGLSESLVATVPYILLSLAVAVGFKTGLFNIGAEGQFYIGAISAAWAGQAFHGLPAIIHLPLSLAVGALGGAIWAGIPGYLKARTGAHEVISTMMMNYVAFRFAEFGVSVPLRDKLATAVQTPRVAPEAELWTFADVPARLQDPLNALGAALVIAFVAWAIAREIANARRQKIKDEKPKAAASFVGRHSALIIALAAGVVTFVGLPALSRVWWPFPDPYDRLHIGLLMALLAAVGVWWLLWKTTLGFEMRTVGANPSAARYAGVSITRNIMLAMSISGALAGLGGTVEVLGVSICRCLPLFFSSGYGFDSIAIALLANNNPFGIVAASFLFGAMRNGADLMELNSGVSKYVISVIQALLLLFAAAPPIIRWLYRIKAERRLEEEAVAMRGWGGG
jgi:simple sugar transport system permease protein